MTKSAFTRRSVLAGVSLGVLLAISPVVAQDVSGELVILQWQGGTDAEMWKELEALFLAKYPNVTIREFQPAGGQGDARGGMRTALMGGEVQTILTVIVELYPHVQSQRVRAIAVSSDKRTTQFPELPTIAETLKGYEFTSWLGCFAPAGTPRPIIDRLSAEIKKAMEDHDVAAKLSQQVLDPMYKSPDEFTRHLKAEYDRMRDVVKLSGARIE